MTREQRMSKEWADYDGSAPVEMVHGFSLYLRPHCEYSRKRFVYRVAEQDDLDWLQLQNLNDMIVFDVGANIGYISCFFLKQNGIKEIHSFEPDPISYGILERNMRLNKSSTLYRCINCAVGEKSGDIDLFINDSHSGDNRTVYESDGRVSLKVPCISIDDYITKNSIHRVDLLKIDVQGAEIDVILGAFKSIKTFNPAIYIEWWPEGQLPDSEFNKQFFAIGKAMKWKYCIVKNGELLEIDLASSPDEYQGNLIIPGAHQDRFQSRSLGAL